ncbi:hypothetical protein BDZ85DRAFT_246488 [Elsinoe ampelina]|uniref:Uncharacterized protein n=1 Tax=Elsinoe ampelina TaxID=302913 RepID=A0A6A6GR49_9PEZI|nr:hypothetical protein BDZ85DRAFT_246488 [Elsinoe ampelina]
MLIDFNIYSSYGKLIEEGLTSIESIEPLKPRRRENLGVIFIGISLFSSLLLSTLSAIERYTVAKATTTTSSAEVTTTTLSTIDTTLQRVTLGRLRGNRGGGYSESMPRSIRPYFLSYSLAALNVNLLRVGLNLATTAAVNVVYLAFVVVLLLYNRYRLIATRIDLKEYYSVRVLYTSNDTSY